MTLVPPSLRLMLLASAVALASASPWSTVCNLKRVEPGSTLRPSTEPYVVSIGTGRNRALAESLRYRTLIDTMGNTTCTPSQASSVRRGIMSMRLGEYLSDWLPRPLSRNAEDNRYVFGEFGDQWAPLRDMYVMPGCRACVGANAAVTIGIGGMHSGAPWHTHGAGYIEMLHGEKLVSLLPPGDPVFHDLSTNGNVSQYHWHVEQRPDLAESGRLDQLRECVVSPGEVLYFPSQWYHGIVNLSPYTAFVSTFLERE
eukprot:TRINITY_DN43617_c0_g1_i1.p2 TRINITY_DN43617_c0_g1~~TRINITY_DN43617_c0_g1_i1.p2  ORF type:complete len:256 (+),score=66.26 TRINITY_DN43617_c0_g1_i1:35-802(+)